MSTRWLLVALVFGVACNKNVNDKNKAMRSEPEPGTKSPAIGDDAAPHSPPAQVDACKRDPNVKMVDLSVCPQPCAQNSPTVNTFPVNGLAVDGKGGCSPEAVQVMPGSLHGGGCTGDFDLTADTKGTDATKFRLVGRNATGTTCEGSALEGAVFSVRGTKPTPVYFTIAKVTTLQLKDGEGHSSQGPEGYLITRTDEPASTGAPTQHKKGSTTTGVSLCNVDASNAVRSDLGLDLAKPYEVSGVSEPADDNGSFAVVVPDPLYTSAVQELDNSHKFFNLACADDALAKRTFEGLTDGDEAFDLAALRMLTATYCDHPYTVRGMTIHWKPRIAHFEKMEEARWMPDRATCLATPRLNKKTMKGKVPKDLPDELLPDRCKKSGCSTWPDWAKAVREECDATRRSAPKMPDRCSSEDYDYDSFVIASDKAEYLTKDHKPPSPH